MRMSIKSLISLFTSLTPRTVFSYEVLSDPEKRSMYDAKGEAGLSEQGGMDPHVRIL